MKPLQGREMALAALVLLFVALAAGLPFLPQDAQFHQFADTRTLLGVPNAQNVLSNLPFMLFGAWGLWLTASGRLALRNRACVASAALLFIGLMVTACTSGWYHAYPLGHGLLLDRMGIVLAFAGTFGMLAADRVSERAGWVLGAVALAAGPASVLWWNATGNLAPYAVMQFGGMLLLLLATLFWRGGGGPRWGWVLGLYALAKVCEMYDYEIYRWSAQLVSGHALKHMVAAGTAVAVIEPLMQRPKTLIEAGRRRHAKV